MLNWIKKLATRSEPPSEKLNLEEAAVKAKSVKLADSETSQQQGNAFLATGDLENAARCYRQALEIDFNFVNAHVSLGYVYMALAEHDKAEPHLDHALRLAPDNADAYYMSGALANVLGRTAIAIERLTKAIELNPQLEAAYADLCQTLKNGDRREEAKETIRKGLQVAPQRADFHFLLARLCDEDQDTEQAIQHIQNVIKITPENAEAYNMLAGIYKNRGLLDVAIENYKKALAIAPDYVEAHNNLGNAYKAQNRLSLAIASYRAALAFKSDSPEIYNNLALAYRDQGELDMAIDCCKQALHLRSDLPAAHSTLGLALQSQGLLGQAVQSYRTALALAPDDDILHSNLLFALSIDPACSPSDYLAHVRHFGSRVSERANPYIAWLPAALPADASRLRIGLSSGDMRNHPVGYFLENLLAHLPRKRFELIAYSMTPQEDDLTARIKPYFAQWRSVIGLSDEAVATTIYKDGISILIDLAGHTAHNRLPVFAWRPAPLQVSWLGYWASTGVPAIDYLLTDPYSSPKSQHINFTETLWPLPETRLCFTPPSAKDAFPLTSAPGSINGHITFGSFQNIVKLTDEVLATWGRIFKLLPDARLRLQNRQMNSHAGRQEILRRLSAVGIPCERVSLHGAVSRDQYLVAHSEVDIILDTFPYTGGTTTCEALWMGVPTLTLAGDTLLSRQSASMLACVGLHDWIAKDTQEYVDKALLHATDVEKLDQLRSELREKALASPLFDAPRFARALEEALHGMWQHKMNQRISDTAGQ